VVAGWRARRRSFAATLPFIVVVGSLVRAAMSLFMGLRRRAFGRGSRRRGVGALRAGAFIGSFAPSAGSVLLGVYGAAQGFFRFVAADTASDAFAEAISWVLAGGLLSAVSPDVARPDRYRPRLCSAYLAMIVLNAVGAIGLWFLDIPRPQRVAGTADTGRRSPSSRASPCSSSRCYRGWWASPR
jgi:hypothetical protein